MNIAKYKVLIGITGLWLSLAVVSFGQSATQPIKLELNKPLVETIKSNDKQRFQFDVKAGQYARVEVEQKNVDVIVSLLASDGKLVIEMDGKNGDLWRETLSCVAEKDSIFFVEIKSYGVTERSGSYKINLSELRLSTLEDRKRVEAETHLSAGRELYLQNKKQEAAKEYEKAIGIWRELSEVGWEAVTLLNLGWTYSDLEESEEAISVVTQAIEIFQKTQDFLGKGKALNALGNIYSDRKQYEKALKFYEQSLILRQETRDKRGEGSTLYNLSRVYNSLGQYQKAKDFAEQALRIYREIGSKSDEANLLFILGNRQYNLREYKSAEIYYIQSLKIYRELKDRKNEGKILSYLADAYFKLEKYAEAIDNYNQALIIKREYQERRSEMLILKVLGRIFYILDQYEKAKPYYKQALIISKEIKDQQYEAYLLEDLGNNYYESNHFQKAIEYYQQALLINQELKNREKEANILSDLGYVFYDLKETQRAIEYFKNSLGIWRELKNSEKEAECLYEIGEFYDDRQQYALSIEYHNKALKIYEQLKNKPMIAQIFIDLSYAFNYIGEKEFVISFAEKALNLARDIEDKEIQVTALNLLGEANNKLGKLKEATNFANESLHLSREIKNRYGEADALKLLGKIYLNREEFQIAVDNFQKSLEIFREIKDDSNVAMTLLNLSGIEENREDYEKSKSYLLDAALLYGQYEDGIQKARIYRDLMSSYDGLDFTRLSIVFGKMSILQHQNIRSGLRSLDSETQKVYFSDNDNEYWNLIYSLHSENRLEETHQILDLFKNQQYFDHDVSEQKINQLSLTPSESEFIKNFEKKIQAFSEAKSKLNKLIYEQKKQNESFVNTVQLKELEDNIKTITDEFKEFIKQSEIDFLKPAATTDKVTEVAVTKQLQTTLGELKQKTGEKAVAIYAMVYEYYYIALVITPTSIQEVTRETNEGELDEKALDLWALLQSPVYDPTLLSKEVYDIAFKPLEEKIPKDTKTILWSLDGNLRYVPMAALFDGKQYLAEKYNHVNFTRADKERMTRAVKPVWTATGLGTSEEKTVSLLGSRISFEALPGVGEEFKLLFKPKTGSGGIFSGEILQNAAFNKKAMLEALKQKRPLVHIASHFSFRAGDEARSFLLLGDGTAFTLEEMKRDPNLFEGVDLLTLSACNTAAQQSGANGREIDGFAELAQRLGANSVMATLWSVADCTTPWLMREFYNSKLNKNKNKAESLRDAQIGLITGKSEIKSCPTRTNLSTIKIELVANETERKKQPTRSGIYYLDKKNAPLWDKDKHPPFAHPFYWSPFILFGNWK